MSRRQSTFLYLLLFASLLLSACGDDSDRTKDPVTDYSNYQDLRLAKLEVSNGSLKPAFNPDYVGLYEVEVGPEVSSIDITAEPMQENVRLEIVKRIDGVDDDPDNEREQNFIEPGEVDTKTLAQGDNIISLLLSPSGSNTFLSYRINVYRQSSNAKLQSFGVRKEGELDEENDEDLLVELNPAFTPETFAYTATVPYERCSVSINAGNSGRGASLSINEESVPNASFMPYNLSIGENTFTIQSESEDEANSETYTLTITRQAPTEEQLAVDSSLKSMMLSEGDMGDFYCFWKSYAPRINSDVEQVQMTVVPSADGATMRYGTPLYSFSNGVVSFRGIALFKNVSSETAFDLDVEEFTLYREVYRLDAIEDAALYIPNPEELEAIEGPIVYVNDDGETKEISGSPLSGPNVAEGAPPVGSKIVEVTSPNGENISRYEVLTQRRNFNRVLVETTEELHEALKTAQPNDEIALGPFVFEGAASEEASGHPEALFYAENSGTAEQPIRLSSALSDSPALLTGIDQTQYEVLRISGDYWEIDNIGLTGARDGLVLDNADHNLLDRVIISDVGERGVVIRNGSSGNVLRRSQIFSTGLAPREGSADNTQGVVVGSKAEVWSSAPEGTMDEQDYDNLIANNYIGPAIPGPSVQVNEGSLRTQIINNIVDADGNTSSGDRASVFVIQGNDVKVAHNSIRNKSGSGLEQILLARNVVRDWVTDSWGENTRYYQNIHELGSANIPLANATDVALLNVAENSRLDGVEVSYTGTGINSDFAAPLVQIQTSLADTYCLSEERPVPTSDEIFRLSDLANLQWAACNTGSEQKFKLINADEGFVYIATADNFDRVVGTNLSPIGDSYVWDIYKDLPLFRYWILNPEDGYMFRWQLLYGIDDVIFVSRNDWERRFALSVNSSTTDVVVEIRNDGPLQRFKIVEDQ